MACMPFKIVLCTLALVFAFHHWSNCSKILRAGPKKTCFVFLYASESEFPNKKPFHILCSEKHFGLTKFPWNLHKKRVVTLTIWSFQGQIYITLLKPLSYVIPSSDELEIYANFEKKTLLKISLNQEIMKMLE